MTRPELPPTTWGLKAVPAVVLSAGPGGGLRRTPAGVDGGARMEIMSFSDDLPALPERPRPPKRVPPYRQTPG